MRSKHLRWCWVVGLGMLLLLQSSDFLAAQNIKTLDRQIDVIVIEGSVFTPDLANAPIGELFLYAYRAATDEWVPIPWQIDERDSVGSIVGDEDQLLDANDQLLFLARDAGDQASPDNWLDNDEARANSRFELEIQDPLDPTKRGWAYLYRSATLTGVSAVASYMEYTPPEQTDYFNDIVRGVTYTVGHKANIGTVNHYSVRAEVGGDDTDIVDQQKARMFAVTDLGAINGDEENSLRPEKIRLVAGPVRIMREVIYDLLIPGTPLVMADSIPLPTFFYPYHTTVGGKGLEIPADLPFGTKLKMFRSSIDFNEHAKGMKLFNQFNSDVVIDELTDAIEDTVVEDTLNWVVVTGDPGTVVFLLDVSDVGNSQRLYYDDSGEANEQEADGTDKTGDGRSIGDTGLILVGDDLAGQKLNLGATTVFLPPNQDPAIGPQLAQSFEHPLATTARIQAFTVPVELVSFSYSLERNKVKLTWRTASETNNLGFEVERRSEGEDWQRVGFVSGSGTSATPKSYSFVDDGLQPGVYEYRLRQIDADGQFEILQTVRVEVQPPVRFALEQNFPNPFNPSTTIRYQVGKDAQGVATQVVVFDLLGREIRRLVDARQEPGYYEVVWDGKDEQGRAVPSGVYFVRLRAGDVAMVKRMLLTE